MWTALDGDYFIEYDGDFVAVKRDGKCISFKMPPADTFDTNAQRAEIESLKMQIAKMELEKILRKGDTGGA